MNNESYNILTNIDDNTTSSSTDIFSSAIKFTYNVLLQIIIYLIYKML